jgi:low temperature requirement protein LtrA
VVSLLGFLQPHLRPTDDNHRVTTLELLFDLVFVYAITNVTGHSVDARDVMVIDVEAG